MATTSQPSGKQGAKEVRSITGSLIRKGGVNPGSSDPKPDVRPVGQAPKPKDPPKK